MRSLVRYSLIALGLLALAITVAVFRPRLEQKVEAQSAPNTVKTKTLVISAFRENGPAGTGDEYVEIFNPRNTNVTVSNLSNDPAGPATGIGVFSNAGSNAGPSANGVFLRCNIPGATVIQGRRWWLCYGSLYSLAGLGANGGTAHAAPVGSAIIGDIPNDAGLALLDIGTSIITACQIGSLNCPSGFNYSTGTGLGNATVFDRVGFRPYGTGAPANAGYPSLAVNFCEGTCLQPLGDASTQTLSPGSTVVCPTTAGPGGEFPVVQGGTVGVPGQQVPVCYGESGQYTINRRRSSQQFDATAGNLYRDTDNNADDFILDAPNPSTGNVGLAITGVSAISSVLGSAFPHNNSAPAIIGPPLFTQSFFDVGGSLAPRNAERRYAQDAAITNPQNDPLGTFILRLKFTATAATTGARWRIDDITTLCGGQTGTNGAGSATATQEARNLRGPDFSITVPPQTTPTPTCQGEGSDAGGVFTAILKSVNHPQEVVVDSLNATQTVRGSVIEDLGATPYTPLGGGSNTSLVGTSSTVLSGTGVSGATGAFNLATLTASGSGATIRIAFKFGVVKSGRFKLLLGPEVATTATPAP